MNDIKIAFTALLITSCMALLFVCALSIQRHPASKAPSIFLALSGICAAIYDFGYAMEINVVSLPEIMFWVRFQHIGIQFIPMFWLMFALCVTGKKKLLTFRNGMLLLIPPLIGFACSQTLGGLNILHPNPRLASGELISLFAYDRGWPIYILTITQSLYIAATVALFVLGLVRGAPIPRKQILIYLLGSIFPWCSSLAFNFGMIPYNIDSTPLALSLSVVLLLYGFVKLGMLERDPDHSSEKP